MAHIKEKLPLIWCVILYNPTQPYVFKSAFLRLSLRLHPRKTWGSKRLAGRSIPSGYFHHGKAIPRQVESQYAGWLLLDRVSKSHPLLLLENIFTIFNIQVFSKLQPFVI